MSNNPAPLSEADYGAIEAAVMETVRGRWFLAEYARRNRHADTLMLIAALDRIEAAVRGEGSVDSVDRIRFDLVDMAKAIARTKAEIAAIKPDAEHHGKFGEATEELDSIVQATESATLRHPGCRRAGAGDRLDAARAGTGAGGLRCARRQGHRRLHGLLVSGPDRPAHPQGDPGDALPRESHQRHDQDLGPRWRHGGRGGRERARAAR